MTVPVLPADAAGLGLRRGLMAALLEAPEGAFDMLEAAPENWIGVGGAWGEHFATLAARHPILLHGLSLSIGGSAPLDVALLRAIGEFMQRHGIRGYSEHLSASSDHVGQLYDLMPLPFDDASVRHVAARVRQVQDILGIRIALENVSYYAAPFRRMPEIDFLLAVLDAADCDLLLDVNNVIVNTCNHGGDAMAFIDAMPTARIRCLHVAGHRDEAPDLKIDTHGAPVSDPVWELLQHTYRVHGPKPTVLERDFNLPPLAVLLDEVAQVRACMRSAESQRDVA